MSELNAHIRQARIDYSLAELDEKMVDIQPLVQFQKWLAQAIEAKLLEPYAMTISTVDHESKPSARIVLLREITDKGFTPIIRAKKAMTLMPILMVLLPFFGQNCKGK